MEKVTELIEVIEQLGADARYENNQGNLESLKIKVESIEWYARKVKRLIEKETTERVQKEMGKETK